MTAATAGVRDFSMLLPPGWARLPLDSRIPVRVKTLVADRVSGAPPEQRAQLQAVLTGELTSVLESAARQGGLDVLLSVDPVAGRAVPASCLVTHLDGPADGVLQAIAGARAGRPGGVREVGTVQVAGTPAVRRLTTRTEHVPADGGAPGAVLTVTQLDYFVPMPAGDGLLVLTFSTPIEQLAPPLVKLFDVMAGSFRWVAA